MTAERQAATDAIQQERKAAFESLGRERAATLQEIDVIWKKSLDAAAQRALSVVDYVFWRILILPALSAVIGLAAHRLAKGPRPARADRP